jgi:hypothetical protein
VGSRPSAAAAALLLMMPATVLAVMNTSPRNRAGTQLGGGGESAAAGSGGEGLSAPAAAAAAPSAAAGALLLLSWLLPAVCLLQSLLLLLLAQLLLGAAPGSLQLRTSIDQACACTHIDTAVHAQAGMHVHAVPPVGSRLPDAQLLLVRLPQSVASSRQVEDQAWMLGCCICSRLRLLLLLLLLLPLLLLLQEHPVLGAEAHSAAAVTGCGFGDAAVVCCRKRWYINEWGRAWAMCTD